MCPASGVYVATVYFEAGACYLCNSDTDVYCANRPAQRSISSPSCRCRGDQWIRFPRRLDSELVPNIPSASDVMLTVAKIETSRLDAMKACAMPRSLFHDFAALLSLEDTTGTDFHDFPNLNGSMSPPKVEDCSVLQTYKAFGSSVLPVLSWGSVMPESVEMEHAVHDISSVSMLPVSPGTSFSATNDLSNDAEVLESQVSKKPSMLSVSISNSAISTIPACHKTLAAGHTSLTANISRQQSKEDDILYMESGRAPQALSNVCYATKNIEHRGELRLVYF